MHAKLRADLDPFATSSNPRQESHIADEVSLNVSLSFEQATVTQLPCQRTEPPQLPESQGLNTHFLSAKKETQVVAEMCDEEETLSTKACLHADFSQQHINLLNTTNLLFEMGSSSLLVE